MVAWVFRWFVGSEVCDNFFQSATFCPLMPGHFFVHPCLPTLCCLLPRQLVQSAGAVLLQREIPESVNLQVAQLAKKAGVPVFLDAGGCVSFARILGCGCASCSRALGRGCASFAHVREHRTSCMWIEERQQVTSGRVTCKCDLQV